MPICQWPLNWISEALIVCHPLANEVPVLISLIEMASGKASFVLMNTKIIQLFNYIIIITIALHSICLLKFKYVLLTLKPFIYLVVIYF